MGTKLQSLLIGTVAGLVVAGAVLYAGKQPQAAAKAAPDAPAIAQPDRPAPMPVKRHYYDMRDGMDYGYTAELTPEQRNRGQAASTVVMVSYAGERDGKHQVHVHEGDVIHAFECASPCEVVKVMRVIDIEGLRSQVHVERIRAEPHVIASMALHDAMSGQLEPYAEYQGTRRYAVWIDDQRGIQRKRLSDAAAPLDGKVGR